MAEFIIEVTPNGYILYEDMEGLVRCRDCRHISEEVDGCWCYHMHPNGVAVKPYGYCAWGESREVS